MTVKVFISYRRTDVGGYAHALYLLLEQEFGRQNVFMDVTGGISAGSDFKSAIENRVRTSDAFLAVIGPDWMDNDRLADPHDFVRFEIETALEERKRIVPILIGATAVPKKLRLPLSLQALPGKEAVRLTHDRFADDSRILIAKIREAPWRSGPAAVYALGASLMALGIAFAALAFLLFGAPLGFVFIFLSIFFSFAGIRTLLRGLPRWSAREGQGPAEKTTQSDKSTVR
jgi:hypothetical protein